MKRFLIAMLIAGGAASYGQIINFEKETYDFGSIDGDAPVSQQVPFENTGKEKLVITEVKASCGCTAGKLAKQELEPGESTFIDITFNPKGKTGAQRKSVTFFSNDTSGVPKAIYITVFIKQTWGFGTGKVTFVAEGGKYSITELPLNIENNSPHLMTVFGIKSNNENVTIVGAQPLEVPAGEVGRVTVKVNPEFMPPVRYTSALLSAKVRIGDNYASRSVTVGIRNLGWRDYAPVEEAAPQIEQTDPTATPFKVEGSNREGSGN